MAGSNSRSSCRISSLIGLPLSAISHLVYPLDVTEGGCNDVAHLPAIPHHAAAMHANADAVVLDGNDDDRLARHGKRRRHDARRMVVLSSHGPAKSERAVQIRHLVARAPLAPCLLLRTAAAAVASLAPAIIGRPVSNIYP